jgi:mono/diheme cytochrome c family protein
MLASAAVAAPPDKAAIAPAAPSTAQVLASERPRDWAYEESIMLAVGADKTYNQASAMLPAPLVAQAPAMNGKLDDPAWSQATAWPLWVPFQKPFDQISWQNDLPLAPMTLLACRHGQDIYFAVRWSVEKSGNAPIAFEFSEPLRNQFNQPGQSASGNGVAQWRVKDTQSVEFNLNDPARRGVGGVWLNVKIVASGLALRADPETFSSTVRRVAVRSASGATDGSTQLFDLAVDHWTNSAPAPFKLAGGQELALSQDLSKGPQTGLAIHILKVRDGKNEFAFPLVFYREPVEETLGQCRHILDHLSGQHEELSAKLDRLHSAATGAGSRIPDTVTAKNQNLSVSGPTVSPAAWRTLYRQARELQSRCMLAHLPHLPPVACFGRFEFGGPFGIGTYMCWNIVDKWGCSVRVFDPAAPPVEQQLDPQAPPRPADRAIFDDPDGTIFDMNISYDAKTLFLAYKHKANGDSYHLYEIPAAGGKIKQLTTGRYHDVHPLLLPNGQMLFTSTRVESYSMCQPGAASAMFVMDRDGGNIHRISVNSLSDHSPQMLPDGRVVFTRWEYIDHGLFWRQALWTINPDGTRVQLLAGNTKGDPATFWQARPIPGTENLVATFAPHHNTPFGAIGTISPRRGLEAPKGDGFAWITQEFPTVGDMNYRWCYCDPFPLSGGLYLVSYGGSNTGRYRIFLMDDLGNKECVYSDPKISLHYPLPLRAQTPPPAIASIAPAPGVTTGTFIVSDVYRGLPESMRGKVKFIQIMEQVPKRCNMQGERAWDMDPLVGRGSYYVKRVVGAVPVEADGSAYFEAPAMREIYFQALDADGRELQRMGSAAQLMPGERQACVGCHEGREQTPASANLQAVRRPPSVVVPPAWGNEGLVDFAKNVQPVFDRNCVKCHSGANPPKGMDLSGDKTRFFNMAYDNLIAHGQISYLWLASAHHNVFQPGTTGVQVSGVLKYLDSEHSGHKVPVEDRRRVYDWVDANVPYYGTYEHTRPGKPGSRDAWAEDWYHKKFQPVYERRCSSCHAQYMPAGTSPADAWVNLSNPKLSRVLTAPMVKECGGLGLCLGADKKPQAVFKNAGDPDFVAMLAAIEEGAKLLRDKPRMDMPGGKPVPYKQDFGAVFSGFAGP